MRNTRSYRLSIAQATDPESTEQTNRLQQTARALEAHNFAIGSWSLTQLIAHGNGEELFNEATGKVHDKYKDEFPHVTDVRYVC